jgi:hypothetical protein
MWGRVLKQAPTRDFGYGVMNHYIASEKLRPMSELNDMMGSWQKRQRR